MCVCVHVCNESSAVYSCSIMKTSSNGHLFRVTGPFCGEFLTQRPVRRSYVVFFDPRLNKRSGKQSRRRWFKTTSRPLWRHCNIFFVKRPRMSPVQFVTLYKTCNVNLNPVPVSLKSTFVFWICNVITDKSALVQQMAWCRQATTINWTNVGEASWRHIA